MVILGWFVGSFLAGWLGHDKGRDGLGFFLIALFLSPLVGIIAALGCQSRPRAPRSPNQPRPAWEKWFAVGLALTVVAAVVVYR